MFIFNRSRRGSFRTQLGDFDCVSGSMFGIIMYDERSSWNNVTRRTLEAMQLAIVEYGVDQNILEMIPGARQGWPLDKYRVKDGNNRILDPWRVIDGRCGILATQRNVAVDRLADL